MKKIAKLFFFLTLICLIACIFVACDDDKGSGVLPIDQGGNNDAHSSDGGHTQHVYGDWSIVTAPTCTQTGLRRKTCECGDFVEETLNAIGHDFVAGVCSRCGARDETYSTQGLLFSLNDDGESYTVTGYGTATDTDVVIPKEYEGKPVTSIGRWSFEHCNNITDLTIPDSVTSIEGYAFMYCSGLKSITIPDSVTSIGEYSFRNCYGLKRVYYTGDIASWCGITLDANPLAWAHNLYINNELVTDLVIPDTVTEIKHDAFYMASCLTSVTIPDSVTSIGEDAFYHCTGLTSVTIPDSVTSIGRVAFYHCTGLTSVTIGSGVTNIQDGAFANCTGLTSITIHDSVTSIGDGAFYECNRLTSITYQGTQAQWNVITKGTEWNSGTGAYTIHCTDGDIAKS